jgi:TolB-like protein/Flp pilus assembly protein TadD
MVAISRSQRSNEDQKISPAPSRGRVLAVLPFQINASDDRSARLAQGFCEDLANNLSRFRSISVISTHSSFHAAQEVFDIPLLADKLGAQYLVQGAITISDQRLKTVAGLIEGTSGIQVWSERYTEPTQDIFEVLDSLSSRLSSILARRLECVEQKYSGLRKPGSLMSYELLLRGYERYIRYTRGDNESARALFEEAVGIDPGLARAFTGISKTHNLEWRYRWSADPAHSLDLALETANVAIVTDPLDARGYSELGFAHLYRHELDAALQSYERAVSLNPNDADVLAEYADALVYNGEPKRALTVLDNAKRLNPIYPDWYLWNEGDAYFQSGQYREAIDVLIRIKDPAEASRLLAASFAHLNQLEEARRYAQIVLAKHPGFSIADWRAKQPFRDPSDVDRFVDGLRRAGLPE